MLEHWKLGVQARGFHTDKCPYVCAKRNHKTPSFCFAEHCWWMLPPYSTSNCELRFYFSLVWKACVCASLCCIVKMFTTAQDTIEDLVLNEPCLSETHVWKFVAIYTSFSWPMWFGHWFAFAMYDNHLHSLMRGWFSQPGSPSHGGGEGIPSKMWRGGGNPMQKRHVAQTEP